MQLHDFSRETYFNDDTICAPFTPPGRAAMSAIRLSGASAFKIAAILSRNKTPDIVDRQLNITTIYDTGQILDKPLAAHFPAPNSFTGEDVVEFHLHGSPYIVNRMMRLLTNNGAREALPGEFSFRAYINGRMDLTQAEALADLINSRTATQHRAALSQLAGGLKEKISAVRNTLLKTLAAMEVTFDYPGEVVEAESANPLPPVQLARTRLSELLDTYQRGRLFREGVRLGIFGRPNVGKSSLLNRLLGHRRALVDPEPGTTRDVIEAPLEIAGIELKLIDTAGLRGETTGVEAAGQQLAREELRDADLKLLILDGSEPLTPNDLAVIDETAIGDFIIVVNKNDLPVKIDLDRIKSLAADNPVVSISCLTGDCIDSLLATIGDILTGDTLELPDVIITNSRHMRKLEDAISALDEAIEAIRLGHPDDIVAIELRTAIISLESITGGEFIEDIYETIFSGFCVGK